MDQETKILRSMRTHKVRLLETYKPTGCKFVDESETQKLKILLNQNHRDIEDMANLVESRAMSMVGTVCPCLF